VNGFVLDNRPGHGERHTGPLDLEDEMTKLIARGVAALVVIFGGVCGLHLRSVEAQQLFVYPKENQSPQQQARDEGECQQWAMQQTGYNPFNPPPPPQAAYPSSPPPSTSGGVFRGAAGGAALGAVGGAIAGDAGKGAAIGAATGALFGAMRRRNSQREQQEWQAHQQQQLQQQQMAYEQQQAQAQQAFARAFSACMGGRQYVVQ